MNERMEEGMNEWSINRKGDREETKEEREPAESPGLK